ncbi:hypothetical protein GCM10023196_035950 [Actinoallomurus vinaceus]|uniref:Uncharacterized protein n=1 Tax=Actinoallomurus vinaceus TaxID=1080074 RepID=A0ABP8U8Y7_9ACTN
MSDAKLTSSLPKGDANGLGPIVTDLVTNPHELHVVLAIVDCKKITTDSDTGEVVPTVRIRRIEALLNDDLTKARRLMERALEKRTGKTVLPLTLEDELREAFVKPDEDATE